MKKSWKNYLIWIIIAEGIGFLSGWLSRDAMAQFGSDFIQSPLTPPPIVFPIVWTILYAMIGISAAIIYQQPASAQQSLGLNLWILQMILNFFWSPFFFNLNAFGFALVLLIALLCSVLWMYLVFRRMNRCAGMLLIPYLLWLCFALYLNFEVWLLNG